MKLSLTPLGVSLLLLGLAVPGGLDAPAAGNVVGPRAGHEDPAADGAAPHRGGVEVGEPDGADCCGALEGVGASAGKRASRTNASAGMGPSDGLAAPATTPLTLLNSVRQSPRDRGNS